MTILKDDVKKVKGPQTMLSHDEIAKELGVSRAMVSMLEKKALEKVRRALRARYDVYRSDDLL